MNSPLANPAFRYLFAAQVCSLFGVGMLTVALSLTAYGIGGAIAGGQVLGLLLALKMVAYVLLAPLAETGLAKVSRKGAMVSLNFGRMLLLLPMAFVTETWQVAMLAFLFFMLAAGFTPLFQSVIPDLLPEKETYTKALAWSRIAYTLEAILSPAIAAAALSLVNGEALYYGAASTFLVSVLLLLMARLPARAAANEEGSFFQRSGRGLRIYLQTPRLRGLFLLNFALSLAMAWVLVNTVVYAGVRLGDAERYYPLLMAHYGVGAAIGAFVVPGLVRRIGERVTMIVGVFGFAAIATGFSLLPQLPIPLSALFWVAFGVASSLVLTPGGIVITRSAAKGDRGAVFTAQFSVSHAGWLVAYPLAGWLASIVSLELALLLLAGACTIVASAAMLVWPAEDPVERAHSHPELPDGHPHLKNSLAAGATHRHVHAYHIDELHPRWI